MSSSAGKNHEGYPDPTASIATSAVDKLVEAWPTAASADTAKIRSVFRAIKAVLDVGGLELVGRMEIRDIKTGKIWR